MLLTKIAAADKCRHAITALLASGPYDEATIDAIEAIRDGMRRIRTYDLGCLDCGTDDFSSGRSHFEEGDVCMPCYMVRALTYATTTR